MLLTQKPIFYHKRNKCHEPHIDYETIIPITIVTEKWACVNNCLNECYLKKVKMNYNGAL